MTYPIGYHDLHPDVSMNFQMNRFYAAVGEPDMLIEMRLAAPRIANYVDWKREFVALAENASQQGHILRSGFYWRAAEFFMEVHDVDRKMAHSKFLIAVRRVYGDQLGERHAVPYTDKDAHGFLPAYHLFPAQPKGTVVFFGGFDSYIEELSREFVYIRDAGYEVIAFDGPGQGGALDESALPMTAEWHKPVSAVLDYFQLNVVTLIGLSLGGCLVLRAAAFEPRVQRVIAFDVLTSFLEVALRQTGSAARAGLKVLLALKAARLVDLLVARLAHQKPVVQWAIEQGMHVTGTGSAYEFFRESAHFQTADVSTLIWQDVLLLAGSEDHYVPIDQWHQQIRMLTQARSITARLFTRSENAQNHCQLGNYGLALTTIVNWLDQMAQSDLVRPDDRMQHSTRTDVLTGTNAHAYKG